MKLLLTGILICTAAIAAVLIVPIINDWQCRSAWNGRVMYYPLTGKTTCEYWSATRQTARQPEEGKREADQHVKRLDSAECKALLKKADDLAKVKMMPESRAAYRDHAACVWGQ